MRYFGKFKSIELRSKYNGLLLISRLLITIPQVFRVHDDRKLISRPDWVKNPMRLTKSVFRLACLLISTIFILEAVQAAEIFTHQPGSGIHTVTACRRGLQTGVSIASVTSTLSGGLSRVEINLVQKGRGRRAIGVGPTGLSGEGFPWTARESEPSMIAVGAGVTEPGGYAEASVAIEALASSEKGGPRIFLSAEANARNGKQGGTSDARAFISVADPELLISQEIWHVVEYSPGTSTSNESPKSNDPYEPVSIVVASNTSPNPE